MVYARFLAMLRSLFAKQYTTFVTSWEGRLQHESKTEAELIQRLDDGVGDR